MMFRRFAPLLLISGCLETKAVECGFGTCPPGTACDEVNMQCVFPDQLTSCKTPNGDKPDLTSCAIGRDETAGICKAGLCITARCGDELVYGDEVCDGSVPTTGVCVDYAYDYGVMSCTEICSESTTSCRRLGWHFRSVPGSGDIHAIWEDGADLYLGGETGLWHSDGATWTGPAESGIDYSVHGVWAKQAHVFVAGQRGSDGVLAHYDGATWTELVLPGTPMWGVFGQSTMDVWAVGNGGTIRHFDGTSWMTETTPDARDMRSIWASGDRIIAVGDQGAVWMHNGSGFISKHPLTSNETFVSVWGASPTDIFIVGYTYNAFRTPIVGRFERYDGDATFIDTTQAAAAFRPMFAVTGRSSSEVYVTGVLGEIRFFDGQSWSMMTSPTQLPLYALHAGAATMYAASQPHYFMEYEGAIWNDSSEVVLTNYGTVRRMYGTDSAVGLFAVGDGCNIHHYFKGDWSAVPYPTCAGGCGTTVPMLDVWGATIDDVYITGRDGYVLHRDSPTQWSCLTGPFNAVSNWSVWGSGASDVYIGGGSSDGTMAGLSRWNGATWIDLAAQVAPHTTSIRDIWGTGPSDVFFVGHGGGIIHFNGSTFTAMASGTTETLYAVWGTGSTDVFAVGDAGTILHYNGQEWTPMTVPVGITVPTDGALFDIIGRAPDDVFAIGGRTLLHYDGTHWAPVTWPHPDGGQGLGLADDQLYVLGDGGVVARLFGRLLR